CFTTLPLLHYLTAVQPGKQSLCSLIGVDPFRCQPIRAASCFFIVQGKLIYIPAQIPLIGKLGQIPVSFVPCCLIGFLAGQHHRTSVNRLLVKLWYFPSPLPPAPVPYDTEVASSKKLVTEKRKGLPGCKISPAITAVTVI